MTTETLDAPESAIQAIEGEVVKTDAELLKEHETIVKRNIKRFLESGHSIARSLNIIYYKGLWKLHKDEKGKQKFTNFNVYLTEEFGWDKTAARARQIMKSDLPLAIEAGDLEAGTGSTRERSAPEISAERCAKVSAKQIENVLDAMSTRLNNTEDGVEKTQLAEIMENGMHNMEEFLNELSMYLANFEAEEDEENGDNE